MAKQSLDALRNAARHCTACPLYRNATQTVFGEGPRHAAMILVGEQPGDVEDVTGKPFVGPAGKMLDRALGEAGVDRKSVYVTNAVKHFKFEPRGKRRIHSKPSATEVKICTGQWLSREVDLIDPKVIVAMGATAALALSGKSMAIGRSRGRPIAWPSGHCGIVTIHPSYLLRMREEQTRHKEFARFVRDLKRAAELIA